jgi:hypothetical protein
MDYFHIDTRPDQPVSGTVSNVPLPFLTNFVTAADNEGQSTTYEAQFSWTLVMVVIQQWIVMSLTSHTCPWDLLIISLALKRDESLHCGT